MNHDLTTATVSYFTVPKLSSTILSFKCDLLNILKFQNTNLHY